MALRLSSAAVLLMCGCCLAQQPEQKPEPPHLSVRTAPQFLIRIALAHITTDATSRVCVIVFPDQSFHLEKSEKTAAAPERKITFVAEGLLTREEQIQAASIVGDPELEKLDIGAVARKPFGYKKVFHEVFASIPRSGTKVQYLAAASADSETFEPAAKTLVTLVETIDARKPAEVKNARRDDCKEPTAARPLQK